ncbi:MAG: GGDEF domain-containing protein [Sulfurimonas sp.]|nr:GGDEF domain-containing protein [Sulfurimonas sp.]
MSKTELKKLIKDMCTSLNDLIENNDDLTKDNISDFLLNSESFISSVSEGKLNSYKHSHSTLQKEFKQIADKCINSYKQTNTKFSELSQIHADTLIECTGSAIDVSTLSNKFSEIHTYMLDEVNRANLVIEELTQEIQALEEKSSIDSLTKIYNRGSLDTYLTDLCSSATANYETYMLILDIDNFKKINDSFGHIAGDKILIYISNILKKTLRDGDKIFRFGGDEFIVILNRIDQKYAINIGNRILNLISGNNLIFMGDDISVTTSIGVSKFKLGDTPDSFILRADKALYKSKHNGKNQLNMELS